MSHPSRPFLAFSALLALAVLASSAGAAPTPQTGIKGTVKTAAGNPLSGISVFARITGGGSIYGTTGTDGTYSIQNGAAGSYIVSAHDPAGRYPYTYWPDVWAFDAEAGLAAATPVEVKANNMTTVDFVLSEGGRIDLTLRTAAGAPIDATGYGSSTRGTFGRIFVDVGGTPVFFRNGASANGDRNDGTYRSEPIPPGRSVYVEAQPQGHSYAARYYPSSATLGGASAIPVPQAAPVPISMTLSEPGHKYSGSFGFSSPPQSVSAAYLYLFDPFTAQFLQFPAAPDRTFAATGLADGIYFPSLSVYYTGASGVPAPAYVDLPAFRIAGADVTAPPVVFGEEKPSAFDTDLYDPVFLVASSGEIGPAKSIPVWAELPMPVPFRIVPEASWLTVTPSSGTLAAGAGAASLRLRGNAAGLAPGEYRTFFEIVDDSGRGTPERVAVRMAVSPAAGSSPAKLVPSLKVLEFTSSGSTFDAIPFDLTNAGGEATTFRANSGLLEIIPSEGTLAPGETAHLLAVVREPTYAPAFGSETDTVDLFAGAVFDRAIPASVTVAPDPQEVVKTPIPIAERIFGVRRHTIPIVSSKAPGVASSTWSSDVAVGDVSAIQTPSEAERATGYEGELKLPSFFTPLGSRNGESSLFVEGPIGESGVFFADPVDNVYDKPGGIGVLELRSDTSRRYGVWTRSSTPSGDGLGSYGQEVPALEESSILPGSGTGVLPVLLGAPFRSNVILVETTGQPADVTLQFRDAAGSPLGAPVERSLAAFEQQFVSNVLGAAPLGYATLVSSGSGRIGALASVIDNRTNDPTTMLHRTKAPRSAGGRVIVPVVAHADGVGGTVWRSDVWFTNTSGAPITLTSSYSAEGAASPVAGASHTVAAGSILVLSDIVASEFGSTSGKGSALFDVTSGDPNALYTTSRTYNLGANGTFGQGVWPVEEAREIRVGDSGLALFGLEKTTRTRTNLIVVETAGGSATVEISPSLDSYREGAVDIVKELAPWQFLQLNDVLIAAGYCDGATDLSLRVRVTSGTGAVTAFASMVDAATGDGTTVPAYR